ncbi:phosphotransferase [Desulfosarcina sp. OttesenSCG-928-A07]|nr:phosphotransferase [Desulfosarcina sp. OttesenSCG-928-A07]
MKALILAAGFGTRLAPHTHLLPKALFPIAGTPVLGRMIHYLKQAGCTAVAVNTHYLADRISAYVDKTDFGIPVRLCHEPEILGTGGAIRTLSRLWDDAPFVVINADIVTTFGGLADVYRDHRENGRMATLVMHDAAPFNGVWVKDDGRIMEFSRVTGQAAHPVGRKLAFTGIQVVNPDIKKWIPETGFQDIIPVYQHMIDSGLPVNAHVAEGFRWQDMGTPEGYRQAVMEAAAPDVFRSAWQPASPDISFDQLACSPLAGDGSDRRWFRLSAGDRTMILADHGITPVPAGSEFNAFVRIGTHFRRAGLPVPRIYGQDAFSGLVFLEDLGDFHLQDAVFQAADETVVMDLYQKVISLWGNLSLKAEDGFSSSWTCQTTAYDVSLILEKECQYFVTAFLNQYLGMGVGDWELADEFLALANKTVENAIPGLIHRDFQSRNIMLRQGEPYLIDFQGARSGPVQYDLASLLIDPYVGLSSSLQERLLQVAMGHMDQLMGRTMDREKFLAGYHCCCATRNLQILGAFGFLTQVKKKTAFARWIPPAARMLGSHLDRIEGLQFPKLSAIAREIAERTALSLSDDD